MKKQKPLFNSEIEENNFYLDYQSRINQEFANPDKLETDRFFVERKLLQYLAAFGAIYTFFTQDSRSSPENTVLLFSSALFGGISYLRESRQKNEKIFSLFNKAHFDFYHQEITKRNLISDKIRLLKQSDKVLPIEQKAIKKTINWCYFLSNTILASAYAFNYLTLGSTILGATLVFAACNTLRYQKSKKQLITLKSALPERIYIPGFSNTR